MDIKKNKKLLLVEDDAIIVLDEKEQLEMSGYDVVVAMNGEDAVRAMCVEKLEIDLVLMDIDLGNGIDGTRAAMEILARRDVPVVFLSSHTEPEIVKKTEDITSYGYVVKNSGIIVLDASIKMAFKLFNVLAERRRAEEALQKTTTELELIFKHMLNAFIVWESVFDDEGNYVSFRFGFFNDAYARIANLRQEDVYGRDVFDVWPTTEKSWVEKYGHVAVTGEPLTFEMYHNPTKGWYRCNAYRPTDTPDKVCVIFEDITRKRSDSKNADGFVSE